MIGLLHAWLLEGSGSNLWTRSVVAGLCRLGETVHLVCQENHPDRYDFISAAFRHSLAGEAERTLERETPYPGKCILHQPILGGTLPVFVPDRYEEHSRAVPMIALDTREIEDYIELHSRIVERIVRDNRITAIHANHAVLMPVVAQRVRRETGVPYAVMPHGSDIEYAVKKDPRFADYAAAALVDAGRVFAIGAEMRSRLDAVFPGVTELPAKIVELNLGVDTARFTPVGREERRANIGRLSAGLAGERRGRTAELTKQLRARLASGACGDELNLALNAAAEYDGKAPDADVEAKLAAIEWESEQVLLFTGRIISMKGIQSVIAALPMLLDRVPELRLVIVGHGPLREPMEALLYALEHGERALAQEIVVRGRALEGDPEGGGGSGLEGIADYFLDLARHGQLERYFAIAKDRVSAQSVVFTGYLTHRELRFLFPCCDVGIFPSVVREAGPLVFLEALASGCFPLGTYTGGMAASIDAVADELGTEAANAMKLDPVRTTADIVARVPEAVALAPRYRAELARVARERYDWSRVAGILARELESMRGEATLSVRGGGRAH